MTTKLVLSTSAFSAIIIDEIEYGINDRVRVKHMACDKDSRPAWCKIRYNTYGDAYIITRRQRYYLEDFIRI